MLACLVLNGCTAMAVRTGVRAVKNIREEEKSQQAVEPGPENQQPKTGLIHQPGLLHGERQAETTNTSTDGQSKY